MRQAVRKVFTSKWFIITASAVALYALTGGVIAPFFLRWYLPRFAEQTWQCQAEVETIRLNPFFLTVEVRGFSLRQADGPPLLAFDRFFVDLETESLWRWAIVLRELTLEKPAMHLEIEPDGVVNLMRLIPAEQPEAEVPSSPPLPFLLRQLDIREAALHLTDKRQSTPAVLAVQDMNLVVHNCAMLQDQTGTYSFAATTSEHEAVQADGSFSLLPLRSQGNFSFKAIALASLWQFARDILPVERPDGVIDLAVAYDLDAALPTARLTVQDMHLAASGLSVKLRDAEKAAGAGGDRGRLTPARASLEGVDCRLRAQLELGEGAPAAALKEVAVRLNGIRVAGVNAKEPLFTMDNMAMEGGDLDLQGQTVQVERVVLHKGYADVVREADGTFGWQRLVQSGEAKAPAKEKKAAAKPEPAWTVLVKSFEIEQFRSRFTDLTTSSAKPVVSLRNINAQLTGIDGASPTGFKIGFEVEQGGSAMFNGTVHPSIPAVATDVDLRGMALMPVQPYLEPFVKVRVRSAFVSARGRLEYGLPKMPRQGGYEGSFILNKLRLTDLTDKPYLSWEALQLPSCRLSLQPNMLEAREIAVIKPVSAVIIGKDKTLNFARMLPEPSSPPAGRQQVSKKAGSQAGPDDAFGYRIGKIRIEGGDIAFTDLSLLSRFTARIRSLQGTVLGLASEKEAQAKVQMEGRVDPFGTASISGVLRPNDFAKASDINLIFRNLEMKALSPYSGQFAGRLIKSGKISADLNYTLQDNQMTGENKVVIDNLVLGDKVETPEDSNLPLDLAIALLKDGNGRIDIGLPVTGDLNDPQFSVGSLVWTMLTNVIAKSVTAPFRMLGSLFGNGDDTEQLETIRFTPGGHDLASQEQTRLLKLAEALDKRPQLKLVVQGRYSPTIDGLELRERAIRRAVATGLGIKPGPDNIPELPDLFDADTRGILEKLYAERLGKDALAALAKEVETGAVTLRMPAWSADRPRKEPGMAAKMIGGLNLYKIVPGGKSPEQAALWAGELYTRLVEREQADREALFRLAELRAQAAIAHLESQGRVARERIGTRKPEPLDDGELPSLTLSLDVF